MLGPRRLGKTRSISCLTSQCMMSKRIKYLIAGLLAGLTLLLPVSGSAVACERAHHRHTLAVDSRATRTIGAVSARRYSPRISMRKALRRATSVGHMMATAPTPAAELLRGDVPTAKTSVHEADFQTASAHRLPMQEILPSASPAKTELSSNLPSSPSCLHAGGCGCCSDNGGCCGMACCAVALAASAPAWPDTFGHAWFETAVQPSEATDTDALLRPPCANV
jgi:hypothetical protein